MSANSFKRRKTIYTITRIIIQIIFFIFFPSAYSSAFAGVKYILTNIGSGRMIEITPFITILIILCVYTIIFGRFFCGYTCAFGSLGDWIYAINAAIAKKIKKKPFGIPRRVMSVLAYTKYFVLSGILLLCIKGLYIKTSGMSPWDVFSMLHSGRIPLSGYKIGCIVLGLILLGMFFNERFFCRILCPMGAVFSILPVIPVFSLVRDRDSCMKGCSLCSTRCPSDIELPDTGKISAASDCFQCDKCGTACPKKNIHYGITGIKCSSVIFTLVRAGLLAVIFFFIL